MCVLTEILDLVFNNCLCVQIIIRCIDNSQQTMMWHFLDLVGSRKSEVRKTSRKRACPKIVVERSAFGQTRSVTCVFSMDQQGREKFTKSFSGRWTQGSNLVLPWVSCAPGVCLLALRLNPMTSEEWRSMKAQFGIKTGERGRTSSRVKEPKQGNTS